MTQYNEAVEEWQLEKNRKPRHITAAGPSLNDHDCILLQEEHSFGL
jgi:hypothetical protein